MGFLKKTWSAMAIFIVSFNCFALSNYLIYPDTKGMPRCLESQQAPAVSLYLAWQDNPRLDHRRIYYRKYQGKICKKWPQIDPVLAMSLKNTQKVVFDNGKAPYYLDEFALDEKTRHALVQISMGMGRYLPKDVYSNVNFLSSLFAPFRMRTHTELLRDVGENISTSLYHSWISSKQMPDECEKLIGSCDYYLCREKSRKCGSRGYFLGFGYQYCSESISRLMHEVSPIARQWLSATATCLQRELEQASNQLSCAEIKTAAIGSHDKCYSEISFCRLQISDVLKIIKMVKPTLTEEGVMQEGIQVLGHCMGI